MRHFQRILTGTQDEVSSTPSSCNMHHSTGTTGSPKTGNQDHYGVKILCTPESPIIDVVFIHGLTGGQLSTWTAEGAPEPWPKSLLSMDLPEARISAFGYDADIVGFIQQASQNRIRQHAENLLSGVADLRFNNGGENIPIIYVAHSLGGLLCENALTIALTSRSHQKQVLECTKAIAFLGTPHRGSPAADWALVVGNMVNIVRPTNKAILEILKPGSEVLKIITSDFHRMLYDREKTTGKSIDMTCFSEELPVTRLGKSFIVVPIHSATLDHAECKTIHADHVTMTKFSERSSEYAKIITELKRWTKKSRSEKALNTASGASSSFRPQFMIPFSRDPNFIGREEILDEIHREHRQKTNQNHARSALVGLGGVGKSQIAIEYAYRVRELTPDCSVFWVHGSNTNRFEQGYTNIASKLQLPGRDDPKIDVLCLVYDWLCDESNGRWLMIIDNADDENTFFRVEEEPEDTTGAGSAKSNKAPLEAFLPQTANGSILITTRNSKVAMSLSGATGSLVRVEPMSEKDAFELLKTKNSDALSDEPFGVDAIALVQALDCIPLAIVQAGAYISSRLPRITLTRYLELFRESEASQRQLLSTVALQDIRRDYSTRHSVTTTFTLSFRQIQQYFPEATDLLALMAMFDRQGIPEDLLHDRKNQLRFEDAVAPLLGYSLITAGLVQPSFTMHRLVQLSMTHWLEKNKQLARWRQRSIEALSNAFPDQEVPPWSKSQALLPHSEKVITDSDEDSNDPNLWTLTENHGWYLFQVGHYRAAESMLRKILKRNEKSLGLGHELCQENVMKLALVLESQGSYQAMEPLLRQSLAANETNSKPSALWSLRQGDQLSKVLRRLGRPKEADILDRKLVSIATEFLPRGFQATLSGSGSLPNSNECQEGKIPLHDLILPESTPIISLMILGQMFERLGQLDPAVQLYKIILAADEKSVGPEHPRTLSTMEVVASVLRRKSAFKEAEDLYRRILTTIEKTMPSNHPDVLVTMYMLVFVLIKQDKFAEAEILLRRVATDINGTPTFEFDKRIWCVQELGNVLMKQNKYHEAEIVLQDGVALEVRELNHEQVNILQNVISLLVDSLKKQEKFEEANATVRRAIQGYQQRLDSLPSDTLSLLWGTLLRLQITVLCDCGRFQDVEGVLKGAHQFLETLRPNHPAEPDFACIFSSLMG